MTGKLQVDRIFLHSICKVWFMSQQNGCLTAGNRPQRLIEAGLTLEYIVHPSYPEAGPGALYVKGIIPQERDAMVLQRFGYELRVALIMITQDGEYAHGGVQFAQYLGAWRGPS